jgi:ubiquinone/menaquinone biosynthesis C-methylase UbiE
MIEQATQRFPKLKCSLQTDESLAVFPDNSFDIVTATFVMHGMKKEKRRAMLAEMRRVSREYVVIHDFYKGSALMVSILEFLERSDYINFKKYFKDEMKQTFKETIILEGENGNALYIGKI